MRLYLSAESKKRVGYTPDWLKVPYREGEEEFVLTLDICGETDYDGNGLNCRTKGDLLPWSLVNITTGVETDFSKLSKEDVDKEFPIRKLTEILHRATEEGRTFTVGVFPIHCTNSGQAALYAGDVDGGGEGSLELSDGDKIYEIKFRFDTELNL